MASKSLHRSVDLVNSVGKALANKQLIKGLSNQRIDCLSTKSTCNIFSVPRGAKQKSVNQTSKDSCCAATHPRGHMHLHSCFARKGEIPPYCKCKCKGSASSGDKILLSISGGQDSVCLLVILNQLCAQMEFKLGLVWCHHLWQIDSFSLMRQITKISYLFQLNSCFAVTPKPIPSELLARNWRHDCSSRICLFYNYYKISLAHSASDRVETVLLNLMRGTGVAGLSPLSWEKKSALRGSLKDIKKKEHVSQQAQRRILNLYAHSACNAASEQKKRSIKDVQPHMKVVHATRRRSIKETKEWGYTNKEIFFFIWSPLFFSWGKNSETSQGLVIPTFSHVESAPVKHILGHSACNAASEQEERSISSAPEQTKRLHLHNALAKRTPLHLHRRCMYNAWSIFLHDAPSVQRCIGKMQMHVVKCCRLCIFDIELLCTCRASKALHLHLRTSTFGYASLMQSFASALCKCIVIHILNPSFCKATVHCTEPCDCKKAVYLISPCTYSETFENQPLVEKLPVPSNWNIKNASQLMQRKMANPNNLLSLTSKKWFYSVSHTFLKSCSISNSCIKDAYLSETSEQELNPTSGSTQLHNISDADLNPFSQNSQNLRNCVMSQVKPRGSIFASRNWRLRFTPSNLRYSEATLCVQRRCKENAYGYSRSGFNSNSPLCTCGACIEDADAEPAELKAAGSASASSMQAPQVSASLTNVVGPSALHVQRSELEIHEVKFNFPIGRSTQVTPLSKAFSNSAVRGLPECSDLLEKNCSASELRYTFALAPSVHMQCMVHLLTQCTCGAKVYWKDADVKRCRWNGDASSQPLGELAYPLEADPATMHCPFLAKQEYRHKFPCKLNSFPSSTIRPLLALNRFDISKLCIFWELPIYPDQSNQKVNFLRNRVRKQLLPTIKLFFNSRIENVLLQFAEIFSDEDHHMNQITTKLFDKWVGHNETSKQTKPICIRDAMQTKRILASTSASSYTFGVLQAQCSVGSSACSASSQPLSEVLFSPSVLLAPHVQVSVPEKQRFFASNQSWVTEVVLIRYCFPNSLLRRSVACTISDAGQASFNSVYSASSQPLNELELNPANQYNALLTYICPCTCQVCKERNPCAYASVRLACLACAKKMQSLLRRFTTCTAGCASLMQSFASAKEQKLERFSQACNLLWTEIKLKGHYVTPSSTVSELLLFKRLYESSACNAASDKLYPIKTIPRYGMPTGATFWVCNRKLCNKISTNSRFTGSNSLFSFYRRWLTKNFAEQQCTHIHQVNWSTHIKNASATPYFYILKVYTKQKNVLLSTLNKPNLLSNSTEWGLPECSHVLDLYSNSNSNSLFCTPLREYPGAEQAELNPLGTCFNSLYANSLSTPFHFSNAEQAELKEACSASASSYTSGVLQAPQVSTSLTNVVGPSAPHVQRSELELHPPSLYLHNAAEWYPLRLLHMCTHKIAPYGSLNQKLDGLKGRGQLNSLSPIFQSIESSSQRTVAGNNWPLNLTSISKRRIIITSLAFPILHLQNKQSSDVSSASSYTSGVLQAQRNVGYSAWMDLHNAPQDSNSRSELKEACSASASSMQAPEVHVVKSRRSELDISFEKCICKCKASEMRVQMSVFCKARVHFISPKWGWVKEAHQEMCTIDQVPGHKVIGQLTSVVSNSLCELNVKTTIGRFFAPSVMDQTGKSYLLSPTVTCQNGKPATLYPHSALGAKQKKKYTNNLVNIFYKFEKLNIERKEIYWPIIISFLPKALQRRFVKLFLANRSLQQVRYSQIEQFLSILKKSIL